MERASERERGTPRRKNTSNPFPLQSITIPASLLSPLLKYSYCASWNGIWSGKGGENRVMSPLGRELKLKVEAFVRLSLPLSLPLPPSPSPNPFPHFTPLSIPLCAWFSILSLSPSMSGFLFPPSLLFFFFCSLSHSHSLFFFCSFLSVLILFLSLPFSFSADLSSLLSLSHFRYLFSFPFSRFSILYLPIYPLFPSVHSCFYLFGFLFLPPFVISSFSPFLCLLFISSLFQVPSLLPFSPPPARFSLPSASLLRPHFLFLSFNLLLPLPFPFSSFSLFAFVIYLKSPSFSLFPLSPFLTFSSLLSLLLSSSVPVPPSLPPIFNPSPSSLPSYFRTTLLFFSLQNSFASFPPSSYLLPTTLPSLLSPSHPLFPPFSFPLSPLYLSSPSPPFLSSFPTSLPLSSVPSSFVPPSSLPTPSLPPTYFLLSPFYLLPPILSPSPSSYLLHPSYSPLYSQSSSLPPAPFPPTLTPFLPPTSFLSPLLPPSSTLPTPLLSLSLPPSLFSLPLLYLPLSPSLLSLLPHFRHSLPPSLLSTLPATLLPVPGCTFSRQALCGAVFLLCLFFFLPPPLPSAMEAVAFLSSLTPPPPLTSIKAPLPLKYVKAPHDVRETFP
ncbi:hypothetical protein C7M84_015170 [Penaeus vannamei]|uniref:Uncharacterized protein n=1 Tax=Penaeus vannamei TaxID=6689 RepID=A0A423SRC8_PENVA|nr:hypothetical protein C7M84_015170 [Penaeus vannamei]